MGRPIRNGAVGTFQVSIKPQVKTCPEEVGIGKLTLPDGTRIAIFGHAFYPSHDRSLCELVFKFLADYKPHAIFLLGGMIHEDAFKIIADDDKNHFSKLTGVQMPPEIDEILEQYDVMEERFLALAAKSGAFIKRFTECGAHVYYVPTLTGALPNEIDILSYVLEQKERADAFADKHDEEGKRGPAIPKTWDAFLGIDNHPSITVLPFGAAIEMNDKMLFKIGDFKRRPGGSAAWEEFRLSDISVARTYGLKVASAYKTLPQHTLPQTKRRFVQVHEIGHLFDIKAGLGYLRKYDGYTQSFLIGTVTPDGDFYPTPVVPVPGVSGRRGFVVNSKGYREDTPWVRAKEIVLPAPKRADETPSAKPAAKSRSRRKGK